MIRPVLAALGLLMALAACGVDGPPTRPSDTPEPGLQVNGEARAGVVSTL